MTPDDLCKSGKEHGEQMALFAWANCAAQYGFCFADEPMSYAIHTRDNVHSMFKPYEVPALSRLFAIHNQGHGDKIRGARAKAEGLKAGVPDIMLPVASHPYHGLFIELKQTKHKSAKNGGRSDAQDDWLGYLRLAGYSAVTCYGWREATAAIKWYLTQNK